MNYEPNTTEWQIGDLVIHDADAKVPQLLMIVTGRMETSTRPEWRTRLLYPDKYTAKRDYHNGIQPLHDPARFDMRRPEPNQVLMALLDRMSFGPVAKDIQAVIKLYCRRLSEERITATINHLVDQVTEINAANGWRERDETLLTPDHPKAQIAGMTLISDDVARTIEVIRKGERDPNEFYTSIVAPYCGAEDGAKDILRQLKEHGAQLYGSKTEAICRARLMDTETMELTYAIMQGDVANMGEELADIAIRVLDFVGAHNDAHPDQPIDLEAAILAKLQRNRERGYRHGGKRA